MSDLRQRSGEGAGRRPVLLIFLDGVGLGESDPERNAFVTAELPSFDALLDGVRPLSAAAPRHCARASLVALDATLGMPGLPQSGTGHASLFTGVNAARLHGRHFGPWVPVKLRSLVRDQNLLVRARDAGLGVAFANAYPLDLIARDREAMRTGGRVRLLRAGPPLVADGAGALVRGPILLASGDAVASEITNERWALRVGSAVAPPISAYEAGRNLARIASAHGLTLYAHYATDRAGHERSLEAARAALEKVDSFLGGLIESAPRELLWIVASDHGNIEDASGAHTRNPALGLVAGIGHTELAQHLSALTDVAPAVLDLLGVR